MQIYRHLHILFIFLFSDIIFTFSYTGNSTVTLADKQKRSFSITVLGDSMILDAYEKNNLVGKIQALLPDYRFNMTVYANNAVRVKNIRERFQKQLIRERVDGVILMAGAYVPLLLIYSFIYLVLHIYLLIRSLINLFILFSVTIFVHGLC